jgi:hypothetical protein
MTIAAGLGTAAPPDAAGVWLVASGVVCKGAAGRAVSHPETTRNPKATYFRVLLNKQAPDKSRRISIEASRVGVKPWHDLPVSRPE